LRPIRLDVDLELDLALVQPTVGDRAATAEAVRAQAEASDDRRGQVVAGMVAAYQRSLATAQAIDVVESLAREAIPLLESVEDHTGLVHVWEALADVANNPCRFEDEAHAAEQAMHHARHIGRPGLFRLPHALVHGPRPADEALRTLVPLLADDPDPVQRLYEAVLLSMLGRIDEAWEIGQEASRRLHELAGGSTGESLLAMVADIAGDHESAARYWRHACDRKEKEGNPRVLSTFAPALGRSLCMLGRYDEAEPLAQLGRELGDEQDAITQMFWRQVLALVLSHRGQHQGAEQLAGEAVAIAERTDALTWHGDALCDLAEVLQNGGRSQEAAAALGQALELYERKRNLAMADQVRKRLGAGGQSVPLA
jgi:tetratricopeptide (TPR) repeat protein